MIYLAAHFFGDATRARRAIEPAFSPDTARGIDSVANVSRDVFPLLSLFQGAKGRERYVRAANAIDQLPKPRSILWRLKLVVLCNFTDFEQLIVVIFVVFFSKKYLYYCICTNSIVFVLIN